MSSLTTADLKPPIVLGVDHVSFTVPDLEPAIGFYVSVFGARELFRLGPMHSADLPPNAQGTDWTAAHLGVADAGLTLAMLALPGGANLQLVAYHAPAARHSQRPRHCDAGGHHLGLRVTDVAATARYLAAHGCEVMEIIEMNDGPLAGKKNVYVRDPFGNPLEIVD